MQQKQFWCFWTIKSHLNMSTPEKEAVVAEEPKAVEANGEAETNEKGND